MLKIYILVFTFLIMIMSVVIIAEKYSQHQTDYRPRISTTQGIIADTAKIIGNDFISVLSPNNKNTPKTDTVNEYEIIHQLNSDIVLFNGLDTKINPGNIIQTNKSDVVSGTISEGLDDNDLITYSDKTGLYNPYFWTDVKLWIKTVSYITDLLIKISPINERVYLRNEELYLMKLYELEKYIKQQVGRIPDENKIIITARNSFDYFGKAYGFRTASLYNLNENKKISFNDILKLSNYIKENNIKVIFNEVSVPTYFTEILQKLLEKSGYTITIGGNLYSDIFDDTSSSYIEMMIHNTNTITNALTEISLKDNK